MKHHALITVSSAMKTLALMLWAAMVTFVSANDLRVVSYNIRHGHGTDDKFDLERVINVLKKHPADFVALQEVDRNVDRSDGVNQATVIGEALGMHHAFAKFMDLGGGQYGMAVLSKYPILETHVHRLPDGAEPRVALEIITQPKDSPTPVSIVCIHLDWTREPLRVAQINTLKQSLEKRTHPVILVGDFNAKPASETMDIVRAGWSVVKKADPPLTWPANAPEIEIDYIATRGLPTDGTTCHVVDERVASDHRPVIATLPMPVAEKAPAKKGP